MIMMKQKFIIKYYRIYGKKIVILMKEEIVLVNYHKQIYCIKNLKDLLF